MQKPGKVFCTLLLLGSATLAKPALAVERGFIEKFCITSPDDKICAQLPFDQADFNSNFEYRVIVKGAQDPFDVFSWQSFVALNWPSDDTGEPMTTRIGQAADAPRVWQSFAQRDSVFKSPVKDKTLAANKPEKQLCREKIKPNWLFIEELTQSDGTALIDQAGNFAVFDTRVNSVASNYIKANELDTVQGQAAFKNQNGTIGYPLGKLASENTVAATPSLTLKTSWRILSDVKDDKRFFARSAAVYIPANKSITGESQCVETRIGLVGMHIVARTESGNGDEWIWTTFEHVDNAPVAQNARDVNAIYASELFPQGCETPAQTASTNYSFFNADCKHCETNRPPSSGWLWSNIPPYARLANSSEAQGTQVVRCWEIFESTAVVNQLWQEKLAGTVWENYMLISTQWRGANKSPLFEKGEVPRFLTNTTMETYQQTARQGTCLGCHADAKTTAGQNANFTFLLQHAK